MTESAGIVVDDAASPDARLWHQLPVSEALAKLGSSFDGMPQELVQERLEHFGYNELQIKRPSALARLLRQFNNALVYILLAATVLTAALGMWIDMAVIVGVIVLNVLIGFLQEGKAEASLEALKQTLVQECTVVRDGESRIVAARELVPGEIVSLESGDRIPADVRLIRARDAYVDESALTGESVPVEKGTEEVERADATPGDQTCMAFSGTFMTRGAALGLVVGTGERTEIGKIAVLMKHTKAVLTPLQIKITAFTRALIVAILLIGAVNFGLGLWIGYGFSYNFLASVSLIVAAIPEMLPMIVTGILALAAVRMARRNALIRRLPAAETLGSTTVICSDKTGTLTRNEMTVLSVLCAEGVYELDGVGYEPQGAILLDGSPVRTDGLSAALRETLRVGLLCNNASLVHEEGHYQIVGDPTEGALLVSAAKARVDDHTERLDEIPFNSESMYMATLHAGENENFVCVKGSPEQVLSLCTEQLTETGPAPLEYDRFHDGAGDLAASALRLLAMARKSVPSDKTSLEPEDLQQLTFLGVQGMIDPPREDAIEAIRRCREAGIRPVMITGDHAVTAAAVARKLGMTDREGHGAVSGEALSQLSDEALRETVEHTSVFARVAPEHKLRIAQQLQKRGEIVAMTGDGVNDAPALKASDIGVAMGITGTEVSKEAASMVLTDDNFSSIVGAVEEGRHAWKNLEKAILYTLPTNGGQALLVIGAVLMAAFVPIFSARLALEPVMILWINLFDSVFLTMPLMMEAKEKGLLASPPRPPTEKLASFLLLERVVLIGLAIAVPGFWIYHHFGADAVAADGTVIDELLLTQAQTAAFWAVLMVHFGYVMSARSVYRSALTFSPFSNKWLLAGIAASVLLRLLPTFIPPVATVFRTESFPLEWWAYILPCVLIGFVVIELEKLIRRRYAPITEAL